MFFPLYKPPPETDARIFPEALELNGDSLHCAAASPMGRNGGTPIRLNRLILRFHFLTFQLQL